MPFGWGTAATLPGTPGPALGVVPLGTVSGGQTAAQLPVHVPMPLWSPEYVYMAMPWASVKICPNVALVPMATVGLPAASAAEDQVTRSRRQAAAKTATGPGRRRGVSRGADGPAPEPSVWTFAPGSAMRVTLLLAATLPSAADSRDYEGRLPDVHGRCIATVRVRSMCSWAAPGRIARMERGDIDASLVVRLLEAQFPEWAGLPIAPVELAGWDNVTFRLGQDMSVRLPSGDPYSSQVAKEHRWLPVLAGHLPVTIPQPLAEGAPGCGYPWPWSVYRWLPGACATVDRVADRTALARSVGAFLVALHAVDPAGGPPAGRDTQYRGGPLTVLDPWTRQTVAYLAGGVDAGAVTEVWEAALAATWEGPPVWFHGDVSASNLLVVDGALSAVIDFGCSGVGDPACDLAIAWTFFADDDRRAFEESVPVDGAAWARGRGWALWKALITHAEALRLHRAVDAAGLQYGWRQPACAVIDDVVADHRMQR